MSFKQILKNVYLRRHWKKKCRMERHIIVDWSSTFAGRNYLCKGTEVVNAHFGYASGTGINCYLKDIVIGKYCCLAGDIRTIIGTHPSSIFVSTHPAFYSTRQQWGFSYVKKDCYAVHKRLDIERNISINIGNDVWVGEGVRFLEGIAIGDGAIIAAGAVVTKDIPPYSIAGGVPARVIRYRFPKDQIEFLLELRWWDKDEEWLKKNAEYFKDVSNLYEHLKK